MNSYIKPSSIHICLVEYRSSVLLLVVVPLPIILALAVLIAAAALAPQRRPQPPDLRVLRPQLDRGASPQHQLPLQPQDLVVLGAQLVVLAAQLGTQRGRHVALCGRQIAAQSLQFGAQFVDLLLGRLNGIILPDLAELREDGDYTGPMCRIGGDEPVNGEERGDMLVL